MKLDRAALREWVQETFAAERAALGVEGINDLLDRGRAWDLSGTLNAGGAVVFPHAGLPACGHQIAAAVHAALDSGAGRALVIGVLHALNDELEDARVRVANGADVTQEPTWGIQGPGLDTGDDWQH